MLTLMCRTGRVLKRMGNNQFGITRIVFFVGFKSKVHEKKLEKKNISKYIDKGVLKEIFS